MFFSLSKEQDFVNYPLITRILLIKWPWKISLLTDGKKWPFCACQLPNVYVTLPIDNAINALYIIKIDVLECVVYQSVHTLSP